MEEPNTRTSPSSLNTDIGSTEPSPVPSSVPTSSGGGFNIDKLHIGGLYGKHRQGHFAGVGVGAGYHLILNHRLSLDFSLSGDFVKTRYDRYREGNLPYREGKFNSYAILPIGTGISLAVML